jgi:hypothetical protein
MASTAMRYRAAQPAALDLRSEARYRVDVARATVRRHGELAVDAELVDISAYGCRLAFDDGGAEAPQTGERLWLRFVGRPALGATLVWSEGGTIGCRFDNPLDPGFVRALTLRLI